MICIHTYNDMVLSYRTWLECEQHAVATVTENEHDA